MEELSAAELGTESTAFRMRGTSGAGAAPIDVSSIGEGDGVVTGLMAISVTTILGGGTLTREDLSAIIAAASSKIS